VRLYIIPLCATVAALFIETALAQNDWPVYGHDPGAARYSTLAQINPNNVSKLTQAWIYNSKPAPDAKTNWRRVESKTTPLVINGVMYFTTPFQSLVAVEPETGKKLWSFDHQYNPRSPKGIAYWAGDKSSPPTLFFGTEDGLLIAVNAKSGKTVPGFANEGELDLKPGMRDNYPSARYGLNGAPAIYKNLVITGSYSNNSSPHGVELKYGRIHTCPSRRDNRFATGCSSQSDR